MKPVFSAIASVALAGAIGLAALTGGAETAQAHKNSFSLYLGHGGFGFVIGPRYGYYPDYYYPRYRHKKRHYKRYKRYKHFGHYGRRYKRYRDPDRYEWRYNKYHHKRYREW